ncbi:MAG: phosphate/phosphite/phosphonate ABC transporter substrate-binding protein [Candidatus Magnetominusculus sp. LBB02]|nr:phosphate/phosphite/phosphonate ABC transporter substrate-binding protein [Candidatus Magnetominusculus sp. LBB02]
MRTVLKIYPVRFTIGVLLCLTPLLVSCDTSPERQYAPQYAATHQTSRPVLIFGIHALHNPQRLYEVYQPIVNYLNNNLKDVEIKLEASRSYDDFEKKLYSRHFDIALPNAMHIVYSFAHGYRVFLKITDDTQFRGIILVRKDSNIDNVTDLRGKTVCYPAPTALAATMLPQHYLQTHGLDLIHDITHMYSGSQESSIMNVYLKRCAAGCTWPPPWQAFVERNPEIAKELTVKWETQWLVNNGIVARDDVPEELVQAIASLMTSLHTTQEGRRMLDALPVERFVPAEASMYRPVEEFLKVFDETVHLK